MRHFHCRDKAYSISIFMYHHLMLMPTPLFWRYSVKIYSRKFILTSLFYQYLEFLLTSSFLFYHSISTDGRCYLSAILICHLKIRDRFFTFKWHTSFKSTRPTVISAFLTNKQTHLFSSPLLAQGYENNTNWHARF